MLDKPKKWPLYFCMILWLIAGCFALCVYAEARPESYYQEKYCASQFQGKRETPLAGGSRCDCETTTHCLEFEPAHRWYEAVGQSLYFSALLNKKAGIVLILRNEKDKRFLERLNMTIKHYNLPIDVWTEE